MVSPVPLIAPTPETSALLARLQEHKRFLLAQDAEVMAVMAERWIQLEVVLEAEIMALVAEVTELHAAGETINLGKLAKMERYQVLLSRLDIEVASYTNWANIEIITRELMMGKLGIRHGAEAIQAAYAEGGRGIGEFFNRLPVSAVENMVGMTSGGPLTDLLAEAYPVAADQGTRALIEGVALGKPTNVIAREMVDGLAGGLRRATVIARTEILRVYREANRQQYMESGAVDFFERLAARGPNTCMACIALDGEIYPTSELMNVHPQEHCSMIPLVKGVPRFERELASEWFEKQDPDLQREMMGPGKFKLYNEGKIGLNDLATKSVHPTWGPSLQVTNLKDL